MSDGIDLVVGPHTKSYMAYGLIATPGGVDTHVHTITPELLAPALSGGVTTFVTAGFEEPPFAMERVLAGMEAWPINIGMQAGARALDEGHLDALVEAGAVGFKIHEDNGAYPDLIDRVLRYADERDVTVSLHTDGLHESAELEDTIAAIAGRTVHAYHVEGTGGGHVPDLLGLVREPSILCSSTTPTIPFGVHTAVEHVPMTVLNHGLSWAIPDDVALVRERVLEARMAAEGPLHELGAISIINSDSQGMGRIGETLRRTFQLAHVMKAWRRSEAAEGVAGLPDDPGLDRPGRPRRHGTGAALPREGDDRARDHPRHRRPRRVAPARAASRTSSCGSPGSSASSRSGCSRAGSRPGARSARGTRRSSVPSRPAIARTGQASRPRRPKVSATFVSAGLTEAQVEALRDRLGTRRTLLPVGEVRGITRGSLVANRAVPPVDIDVRTGAVSLGGTRLAVAPVDEVPLSRRYLLR